jgi:hypothetical protein
MADGYIADADGHEPAALRRANAAASSGRSPASRIVSSTAVNLALSPDVGGSKGIRGPDM